MGSGHRTPPGVRPIRRTSREGPPVSAVRAQTAAPRTRSRPPAGRTPARRPTSQARTGATGRPPARRRPPPKRRPPRTPGAVRRAWHRLAVLAGATLALVTVLAAFAQPPTEAGQVPQPTDAAGQ